MNLFSTKPFTQYTDLALLLLRLFCIYMLVNHGLGKLGKLTSGEEVKFMNFLWLGGTVSLALVVFSELLCSALVALGAFTRLALIPLIITMLVAVFYKHIITDGDSIWKPELGMAYLVVYIALYVFGPGRYSIDALIEGKKR